jgi:hypothetical protein
LAINWTIPKKIYKEKWERLVNKSDQRNEEKEEEI